MGQAQNANRVCGTSPSTDQLGVKQPPSSSRLHPPPSTRAEPPITLRLPPLPSPAEIGGPPVRRPPPSDPHSRRQAAGRLTEQRRGRVGNVAPRLRLSTWAEGRMWRWRWVRRSMAVALVGARRPKFLCPPPQSSFSHLLGIVAIPLDAVTPCCYCSAPGLQQRTGPGERAQHRCAQRLGVTAQGRPFPLPPGLLSFRSSCDVLVLGGGEMAEGCGVAVFKQSSG
jgi:hypothetical protein